jgi:hypothetical protein
MSGISRPELMRAFLDLHNKTDEKRNEILRLPAKTEVRPSGSLVGGITATKAYEILFQFRERP